MSETINKKIAAVVRTTIEHGLDIELMSKIAAEQLAKDFPGFHRRPIVEEEISIWKSMIITKWEDQLPKVRRKDSNI